VIKQFVIPEESQLAQRARDAFAREYSILEKIDHPGPAKVIERFEEGRSTYLVLEHIKGIDLRSLVESRGPRNEKTVWKWLAQLCEQLQYLHEQDTPILHRDLTPDNIMLDENGNIRIIDFGAAHEFMENITGTLIGKQAYIAPEQLRGKATRASDIYSLGQMMFFLLTGRDPRALNQSELLKSGIQVSHKMDNLVSRCTAFGESDRIHSVEQLLALINDDTTSAPAPAIMQSEYQPASTEVLGQVPSEEGSVDAFDPADDTTAESPETSESIVLKTREEVFHER